jgi:2,3-bisphosphoglycerate-dependent phosphoglycerate mutase
MTLIVVRHGESIWNKENRFAGWTDIELSEEGIQQAILLGEKLKTKYFDYIISSDLKRATDTVLYALNTKAYITSCRLRERNYGDLTGLTKNEIKEKYGDHIWKEKIPNGESPEDVFGRVKKYIEEVLLPLIQDKRNILLVAHDNVLRAIFLYFGVHSKNSIDSIPIPNAHPFEIIVDT